MENLIKQHKEKFGIEPFIIGMFWSDRELLKDNIKKAIETNKTYNEYELLSDDEKKAFDNGNLLFQHPIILCYNYYNSYGITTKKDKK